MWACEVCHRLSVLVQWQTSLGNDTEGVRHLISPRRLEEMMHFSLISLPLLLLPLSTIHFHGLMIGIRYPNRFVSLTSHHDDVISR